MSPYSPSSSDTRYRYLRRYLRKSRRYGHAFIWSNWFLLTKVISKYHISHFYINFLTCILILQWMNDEIDAFEHVYSWALRQSINWGVESYFLFTLSNLYSFIANGNWHITNRLPTFIYKAVWRICASIKWDTFSLDYGLSLYWRQAII